MKEPTPEEKMRQFRALAPKPESQRNREILGELHRVKTKLAEAEEEIAVLKSKQRPPKL